MGIKGLTKFLKEFAPSAIRECKADNFHGKRVAIDASMCLYQFLVAVRSGNENLETGTGETTSHLIGMFYRTCNLFEKGIKPIFVFDGKPPEIKAHELEKRRERREKDQADMEAAEKIGDDETAIKLQRRLVQIKPEYIEDCKKLFTFMGVPFVNAVSEAEAECANLVKLGHAYAVGTEDMDAITFGTDILLRHLSASKEKAKKQPVVKFTTSFILKDLKLTHFEFVDLCILMGCDYCETIRGIGPKKAFQLIKQHRSIDEIVKYIDKKKYPLPEDWNYAQAREMFLKPLVHENKDIDIKFEIPDKKSLLNYMVTEKGFAQERILKAMEKITKSDCQPRLTNFFKSDGTKRSERSGRRSERRSRSRSRDRDRRRRSRSREGRRGRDEHRNKEPSPKLTSEEKDMRTVFLMQLGPSVRTRDIENFFRCIGDVRDVKLIMDTKTRRPKGIAYVEFYDIDCVSKAIALSGKKMVDRPVKIVASQAEKNRMGAANVPLYKQHKSNLLRLYVGNLHASVTDYNLEALFEPFGTVTRIKMEYDRVTGRSLGYGYVTYTRGEDAKRALDSMNGFELAGLSLRVSYCTEKIAELHPGGLDNDGMDHGGIDLGAAGKLQLMQKLAHGTGMVIPTGKPNNSTPRAMQGKGVFAKTTQSANRTPCFMLSNMFDTKQETGRDWDREIRDDVIEQCTKFGGVIHVYVDKKNSQGNVYVKSPSNELAEKAVNGLHGRWFGGKMITAAYIPVQHYHKLFPSAAHTDKVLTVE